MKYIDADLIEQHVHILHDEAKENLTKMDAEEYRQYWIGRQGAYSSVLTAIRAFRKQNSTLDSLQQEQQDFPTTDEQVKEILATHPKVEVSNKYKTPDWLWKKLEQPEVDLKKEYKEYVEDDPVFSILINRNVGLSIARHFAEWGAVCKESLQVQKICKENDDNLPRYYGD